MDRPAGPDDIRTGSSEDQKAALGVEKTGPGIFSNELSAAVTMISQVCPPGAHVSRDGVRVCLCHCV